MVSKIIFNKYSYRKEKEDTFLVYTEEGLFEFNEIAFEIMTFLKNNLDKKDPLEEVCNYFSNKYSIKKEILKKDIDELILQFINCALIRSGNA